MALLFDLDGVIIHSMPLHNKAWEVYLERHGIPAGNLEERMHGRRNDDIVRSYFGDHLPEEEVHHHGAAKEALFREMMQPVFGEFLVSGMREFLSRHDAVPTGLATNAERKNVDFVLDGAEIRGYFDAVIDGSQVDQPKPRPDVYLRAAEELGIHPRNCVVFEDSNTGIQAAIAAGARVVGLTTTLADPAGVDLAIRDFRDQRLEEWLSRQSPVS